MSLLQALDSFDCAIGAGQFNGYGPMSIPSEQDTMLEGFLSAYVAATQSDRDLATALPSIAPQVLLAFCERQAILAVRSKNPNALRLSLQSAGIASVLAGDFRDVALCLVLPWHSAQRLGIDPAREFNSVAQLLPSAAAGPLEAFARREPADNTLECMGYREVGHAENFSYERDW